MPEERRHRRQPLVNLVKTISSRNRDVIAPDLRNRSFEGLPSRLDGSDADLADLEAAPLVEAKGVEVVVGGHDPEATRSCALLNRVQQRRPHVGALHGDVEVDNLDLAGVAVEGHDAHPLTLVLSD